MNKKPDSNLQFVNAFIKAIEAYGCNGTEGVFIPKHEIERLLFLAKSAKEDKQN